MVLKHFNIGTTEGRKSDLKISYSKILLLEVQKIIDLNILIKVFNLFCRTLNFVKRIVSAPAFEIDHHNFCKT